MPRKQNNKMLAYFDCFSGISGDMTLGAFIDLGVPAEWLTAELSRMPLSGFKLSVAEVNVHGIRARQVTVETLPGSASRNYRQIKSLIGESPLPPRVKERSGNIFERLAAAEAGIHNCPKEAVHFHEVGGVDAIVDIVGTALSLEFLNIDEISASKIPLGSGFVKCRHGTLPVPAPATLALLEGIPVYGTDIPFELVTPTGAAIVSTLSGSFGKMGEMAIQKAGCGAGSRRLEARPNLLRIIIGRKNPALGAQLPGFESDTVLVIETNVDDLNPEILGYAMERLFEVGALDVCLHPVYMKKNRSGTLLQVICEPERKAEIASCILAETTSLGIRYHECRRQKLKREEILVTTSLGEVQVKKIIGPSGTVRYVPEFEVCRKLALARRVPIQQVYHTILRDIEPK